MSEDSDATVAEGALSDCCSDAEGVGSPSLLRGMRIAARHLSGNAGMDVE